MKNSAPRGPAARIAGLRGDTPPPYRGRGADEVAAQVVPVVADVMKR